MMNPKQIHELTDDRIRDLFGRSFEEVVAWCDLMASECDWDDDSDGCEYFSEQKKQHAQSIAMGLRGHSSIPKLEDEIKRRFPKYAR
jgi:hypothetical protein